MGGDTVNKYNEIIIPNIPELSLSVNTVDINSASYELRSKHFHKEFEFFRIDEGTMLFCTDSVNQQVSEGDVIFINSYFIHEIKPISKQCKATYFQLDLQPYINSLFDLETNYLYNYMNTQSSIKFKVFSSSNINDIINNIDDELKNKLEFYDIQVKAYISQLVVYLFRYNFITDYRHLKNSKSIRRILPAITYINDNIDKKILLDELCDLLHIDKYYFCKLFKQTTGSTFTEYINFARLNKATQLLINEQISISEIALACGFSSTQYFNKLFKKYHGFTPTYYKKIFMNNNLKD